MVLDFRSDQKHSKTMLPIHVFPFHVWFVYQYLFALNVNINHSWICKGLQTSNGTDHGIYILTETLKPQIGILNLSSHTHIFASFFNPRKFQQTPGTYPRYPKVQIWKDFLHKQVVFRVWGMFQGCVGVFLQIQLFLPDRDFPWFTFFFVNFMMELCS